MRTSSNSRGHGQGGLTRTEVLVVASFLLLLASLVFTLTWRGRGPSGQAACMAKLRKLAGAFEQYGAQHGTYPAAARLGEPATNDWIYWQSDRDLAESAIAPFLQAPDINALVDGLVCPLDGEASNRRYQFSYTMNAHLDKQPAARLENKPDLILLFEEQKPNDGACAPGILSDRLAQWHGGFSHAAYGDGRVELVDEIVAVQPERTRPIVQPIKLPPREVPR